MQNQPTKPEAVVRGLGENQLLASGRQEAGEAHLAEVATSARTFPRTLVEGFREGLPSRSTHRRERATESSFWLSPFPHSATPVVCAVSVRWPPAAVPPQSDSQAFEAAFFGTVAIGEGLEMASGAINTSGRTQVGSGGVG
jgi:hypothetical protein